MSESAARLPISVPEGFTKPSSSYRWRARLAMLGLLLFLAIYIGLACWFTSITYRMIAGVIAGGEGAVASFFAAIPSAFLSIFMWKALFFIRSGSDEPGIEITAESQKELFEFLYGLADEIGAPRPRRVYLSPGVNAAVFYDLSIINLIIPTQKNLVIGLGLVNSLNRTEFKAVLAHEFGHFAQRTMTVGRWVYMSEQIASHIVHKRDALDRLLDLISGIDIRIAWIGWIMRTVVWSIRSLMDTVFCWVSLAHRALSREMEFQADLVAVSVTGSDPLVHALHRLQPADNDWELTLDFAGTQLQKGKRVSDLYTVQKRIGENLSRVLDDPTYGRSPVVPEDEPSEHRVFSEELAHPPRMWSTHPANTDREANAKRTYIPADLSDNESAWVLFDQPQQLRETMTEFVFRDVEMKESPRVLSESTVLQAVDENYSKLSYAAEFQGCYLGRSLTTYAKDVQQLFDEPPAREEIDSTISELYPEELKESVTALRKISEEISLMEAVEAGVYDAAGGVVKYAGRSVLRAELPQLVKQLKEQRTEILGQIQSHDRKCRTTYNAAARYIGRGWKDYHRSLVALLHYAEHSLADLRDAYSHFMNTVRFTAAAGPVSRANLQKILKSANDLQGVMYDLNSQVSSVKLPPNVKADLEVESWRDAFQDLELPPANDQNINQWVQVLDSWVQPMLFQYDRLQSATLDELLRTEQQIANLYQSTESENDSPPDEIAIDNHAKVPTKYSTRLPEHVRPKQKRLDWWSRFRLADGMGPAALRFVVALSIVGAVLYLGMVTGNANVIVYNGLSTPVDVRIADERLTVSPHQHRSVSVGVHRSGLVEARAPDGRLIESFEADMGKGFASYVYNIASAAPMVEWTAVYGSYTPSEPENLGCPRWRTTSAEYIFTEPPNQIRSSGSGSRKKVLSAASNVSPLEITSMIDDSAERERVTQQHIQWDQTSSKNYLLWLEMGREFPELGEIVSERLALTPDDVPLRRMQQDLAKGEAKETVRVEHQRTAESRPDDVNWQYLAARALPDGEKQDTLFLEGYQRWPDNRWFCNAAGNVHAEHAHWEKALECFEPLLEDRGILFEATALVSARVRRAMNGNESADLQDLSDSSVISMRLMLEKGEGLADSPFIAVSQLNNGQLEKAYQAAGGTNATPSLLILISTSQGAQDAWQDQALQIPVEELESPHLCIYVAALAFRRGQPTDRYLAQLETMYEESDPSPLDFYKQFLNEPPTADLESQLDGLDPFDRGVVLTIATIMYPDRVQTSWRDLARRLLFAVERPYL